MATEQGPMSGFRDMLADQMIPREEMLDTIKEVYEGYGFVPLKTPALERLSTLTGKYGEEGDKLMYKFEDNGGRPVALRYDQTVPLARVVAQHGGKLPSPYKRYAVGEVWRGESPQAGRYREFTQFDADIVGTTSPVADAEIVAMMSDSMAALGADSLIRVNNRRILDALVEKAGVTVDSPDARNFISTIDKVEKIGNDTVVATIQERFNEKAAELVAAYLSLAGSTTERLGKMATLLDSSDAVSEGVDNLMAVFKMLEASGYDASKIVFDQTIARGLDYYTGIIYETTLRAVPQLGSVCSGGRFDNLVKAMGGPDLPAVGTSIGVDRLFDGLQQLGVLKSVKTNTRALITNFSNEETPRYMTLASKLRAAGLPTEVYYDATKLGKQIRMADQMGIPYVLLMGPQEIEKGVVVVRTLASGEQQEIPIEEAAEKIRSLAGED